MARPPAEPPKDRPIEGDRPIDGRAPPKPLGRLKPRAPELPKDERLGLAPRDPQPPPHEREGADPRLTLGARPRLERLTVPERALPTNDLEPPPDRDTALDREDRGAERTTDGARPDDVRPGPLTVGDRPTARVVCERDVRGGGRLTTLARGVVVGRARLTALARTTFGCDLVAAARRMLLLDPRLTVSVRDEAGRFLGTAVVRDPVLGVRPTVLVRVGVDLPAVRVAGSVRVRVVGPGTPRPTFRRPAAGARVVPLAPTSRTLVPRVG